MEWYLFYCLFWFYEEMVTLKTSGFQVLLLCYILTEINGKTLHCSNEFCYIRSYFLNGRTRCCIALIFPFSFFFSSCIPIPILFSYFLVLKYLDMFQDLAWIWDKWKKKMKQNAKQHSQSIIAKHSCVIKVKIPGNVRYVTTCFSWCYNDKGLQNSVKFGIKSFHKSPLYKYVVKFTSWLKYLKTGHSKRSGYIVFTLYFIFLSGNSEVFFLEVPDTATRLDNT